MKETNLELNTIAKPTVESNLISICLKHPEKIVDIQEQDITEDMFLIEANRYIFMAINYLFHKRQDPTPYAIMEVIANSKMKKVVEEFGGVDYLEVLSGARANVNNLDILCQKLKQAYTRFKLCEICDQTKDFVLTDKAEVLNPSEILGEHESKIAELSNDVQQTKDIYKMGENTEEILKQRAENPNTVPGLEVGWNKFDYYTNGGQPGDLIMVCARAKTGKSTTLTNWAVKLGIEDNIPILYFDTEMSAREQEDRILSILSGVPHKEIMNGMYCLDTEFGKAEDKKKQIREAIAKMRAGSYYHIYMPNFTIEKVNAIAKKFKIQNNIQAIFFDYLKFPSSQVANLKSVQEWQMLGYIASGLKDLAGTLKVPVYSGCQENRSNLDSDKKDERNVGGSDRILQLASKLIFLSNKSEDQIIKEAGLLGNQKLYIAYQRNGESDCPIIDIQFDRTTLTQREV